MRYTWRKTLHGLLLILGVTLVSFILMVWFGPDQTYNLIGKNATTEQIAEVRHQLGYDRPFHQRYFDYVKELFTLNLGASNSTGEQVSRILPLMLPGFIIGNLLGIALGLLAAYRCGRWSDRLINALSIAGMSISFLIIIIALQVLLSTPFGLNLFPARGWQVVDLTSYLAYVTVPTLALVLVTLGYRTARAFGASPASLMWRHVLKNSLPPIITRIMFSIPLVVISGSLLIESYFGIPGIGKITFDAITSGDQPVLKAVVGMTAVLFVLIQILTDFLYRIVDPRTA